MNGSLPRPSRTSLQGRPNECTELDRLVSAICRGESRSLALRGDAGIGKTALLEYLVDVASDVTVVRAVGVEPEMEFAFASLHQLCGPLLDRLELLPAPQREALEIVFGVSAGAAPDRFLIGLGVLRLLSEVAEERPLLCVVDDAQWLDQASALTLAFVARRLLTGPVGLVFASRERREELQHVPELELQGLRDVDARELLGPALRFMLDERVRERIIAETRGNPLALLQLPRALTATQPTVAVEMLGAHARSGRIEESYVRQLKTLPEDARVLMLLAAAEPVGDPLLLLRAAQRLGIAVSAVDMATGGLLELGERVTFRDPLVRSAVYRSAGVPERRAAHLALAEATDRDADPDRRAWHLAAAAAGPDEAVALELERSAGRAQGRGGLAAAAGALRRALALTGDPARRADRALAASHASLQAGTFNVARRLLTAAEVGPLDALQRARLDLMRAEATASESRGGGAPALLLRAAKALEALDPELARDTYLDAWGSALFAGGLARAGGLLEVSRAARAAPRRADDPRASADHPRASDLLLDGFALALTEGRSAAAPALKRAAAGFAGNHASTEEVLRWGWLATGAAVMVWDYETSVATCGRGVQLARDSGALSVLAVSADVLAQVAALGGDFDRAASLVDEADGVMKATGTRLARYGALALAGLQGREADASRLVDGTIKDATAGGQGAAVQYARWASSVLLNGLGRYREALDAAQEASDDTPELFVSVWALSELIESATRCDEREVARSTLERLSAATAVARTDWSLGIQARSAALLSQGESAERLYQEALDRLNRTPLRPELARAHLLYGEWLRRENRRVDARLQLRAAQDLFTTIGMEAFAERARGELQATGEKVRKRTVESRDELTAQEQQIARLAGAGLSNPEIGARLFLSPRTVEWHLRKVFTKLDIRSRRELANALPSSDSELVRA